MKILIVFYSRSNATKTLAEALAKDLGADLEELKDHKDWSGPVGWVKAGRAAMMKQETEIDALKNDPALYDLVLIGSPVWAGTFAPAVRMFIKSHKENLKKVAFFSTQASDKEQGIFNRLEEFSDRQPEMKFFFTTKEIKSGAYQEKIKGVIKDIKKLFNDEKLR
jgi:menaquinone-dependent protoporphyrinogen IX oxidase